MGGGSLLDVGIYQAHLWRALIHGEPELNIELLTENIGVTGVDLTTRIVGKLNRKMEVRTLSSFEMPERQELVISGDLATIECPGNDAFTSWNKPSLLNIGDHLEKFAPVDPYRLMIENVSAFILGESAWIPAISHSLHVARMLDQIRTFDR